MSDETPENTPSRTCTNCSAPLAGGQDWCLECGAAQPGRLGGRPGWRAALTVIGVTTVLVGGAGAAAYAALSSDAQRDATAQAPPTAAPQVAQPPVITAAPESTIETTPTTPTTAPSVTTPGSDGADVPAPGGSDDAPATPVTPVTPVTPATPVTPPSNDPTTTTTTGTTTTTETTPDVVAIDLAGDAANPYDPYDRVKDADKDDSDDAIDGNDGTAYEIPVAGDGSVNVGVTVRLSSPQQLSKVLLTTDTPGFTVELYATTSKEQPKDVIDDRWDHIANKSDVGNEATLNFKKEFKDKKYRRVLLWFTKQPADTKVIIPEIQVFPNQ
jgi:hypothetical protein